MIARDAAVIAHRSPLPRIELHVRKPAGPAVAMPIRSILELLECDRIWSLIQEASR